MSSQMQVYARLAVVCVLVAMCAVLKTQAAAPAATSEMRINEFAGAVEAEFMDESEFVQPTLVEEGELSMSDPSNAIDAYTSFLEEELFQLETLSASPAAKQKAPNSNTNASTSTKKDAASRLTSATHKQKYDRFRQLNANKAGKSGGSFATFTKNRETIVALNDKHGSDSTPTIFRSTGPFADLSEAEFKARYLTARNPSKRKNKASPMPKISASRKKAAADNAQKNPSPTKFVRVPKSGKSKTPTKSTKAKKGGIALIESTDPVVDTGAGHAGGFAGGAGGKSGKSQNADETSRMMSENKLFYLKQMITNKIYPMFSCASSCYFLINVVNCEMPFFRNSAGAYAGSTGKKSGKTGGEAGGAATKSGKTGGDAGGTAKKSGKTGGESGGNAKKSGKTGGESGKNASKSGKTGGNGEVLYGDSISRTSVSNPTTIFRLTDVSKVPMLIDLMPLFCYDNVECVLSDSVVAPDQSKFTGFRAGAKGVTRADVVKSLATVGVSQASIDSTLNKMLEYGSISGISAYESQGTCGSCWAEAVSTSLFFTYLKYGNKNDRSFVVEASARTQGPSVQQILDCARTSESKGCRGGTPMDALDYLASVQVASVAEYPRQADFGTGKCRTFPKVADSPLISYGWKFAVPDCKVEPCIGQQRYELNLLEQLVTGTSIPIVYLDASKWQHYSSGIFPVSECSNTLEAGNHIVQIVAVGTDENGVPFWELINSWGKNWGQLQGRIRLPFGVNACGIANFAIVPRVPSDVSASSYGIDSIKDTASTAEQIAKLYPSGTDGNRIRDDKCMYDVNKKLYLDYSKVTSGKGGQISFSAPDISTLWSPVRTANCNGIVVPTGPAAAPAQEKMPYNKDNGYVFDKVAGGWRKPRPGDIY